MNYKEKFLKLFKFLTKKNDTPIDKQHKNSPKIQWLEDGKLHRVGGQASYHLNDKISHYYREEWHENGILHRIDGPAIYDNAGYSEYWVNGKKHRTDGPAVIKDDADQYKLEWWVNGEQLSYEAFQSFLLHEEVQKEIPVSNTAQPKRLKL